MTTISTCLIVKNESSCIERCIKSLQLFSDEIIIYDTGSDDGTQEICKSLDKVKLIQGEWRKDFAWARNESFKYATCDYIMWVDADDIIDEKSQEWILHFKETELSNYSQVNINYIYDYSENGTYSLFFYRERLLKRSDSPYWIGRIHEFLEFKNCKDYKSYDVPFEDANIKHLKHSPNPYRNLNIYKDMEKKGELNTARDWFYYGRECEWHENNQSAIDKYKKALSFNEIWYIDKLNIYIYLSDIYRRENDDIKQLEYAYLAASCTKNPRADVCCILGDWYFNHNNMIWARKWYESALDNEPEGIENTFMNSDRTNVYPLLQLCVVEYNLGNIEKSESYNEKIFSYDSNNEIANGNKIFFNNLKK